MALNSKTNIKLIDALCEGPIEGLAHIRRGVFLDETLVTGAQFNAQEGQPPKVVIDQRRGVKRQKSFADSLLGDVQTNIVSVGVPVGTSYSETVNAENKVTKRDYGPGQVTREIRDADADFVRLVFTVPRLYCRAVEGLARGQLFFGRIKFEVAIDRGDGRFEQIDMPGVDAPDVVADKNIIKGISTSPFQFKTPEIKLADAEGNKSGTYKIRVRKVDFSDKEKSFEISFEDLEDLPRRTPLASSRANDLQWTSIIVGTNIRATYPFTALAFLSIDAEEYGTLPSRAYDIKGKKVRIPSNAEPRADGSLAFSDDKPFDGSLKTNKVYTTCPVCCFYDLLTNDRYGCGDFINESNLNWIDLIEIAKYCNERVTNADGSKEARFAVNTVIGTQAEAYNVLQDMASVFRGMLFWKADNVQVAADHGGVSANVVHVFSNSNVVDGSFSYSGSSLKTRSTRVRVRYNDPDDFFRPNFICIEDTALIKKFGVQEKSVVAFGCTSKFQAQRMGKWIMQSEKLHDDTVTFSVGLEGLNVLPGQVFEVSDEMRIGTRLAGRIVGARRLFVDLDQPATLPSGSNNKLTVVMKDGSLETRDIAGVSGNRVTLSSKFTQVPPDNALYAISNDSNVLRKYRCLAVAEGEGGVYSIVGVRHVDTIYNIVDSNDASLELGGVTRITGKPAAPSNLKLLFQQIDDGRNTTNQVTFAWERGSTVSVSSFKVRYKMGEGGNFRYVSTNENSVTIQGNMQPGKTLFAEVQAVGLPPNNTLSDFAKVSREVPVGGFSDDVDGKPVLTLPPDPEDVEIEASGVDQVILRWAPTASGQKIESFVAMIKHSSKTDGTGSWQNSTLLRKVEARTTSVLLPLLNGEYLIKFENEQGQRSTNAISALINVPDPIPRLNYEIFREDADYGAFTGQSSNVYYNDTYDGLVLSGDGDFDLVPSVDALASFDFIGAQVLSGEYFFFNTVDLGAKYSVRMQRVLSERGLYLSDLIDDRTEKIDIWSDFDGDIPDDTNAQVYFRKSDNGETLGEIVNEDGDKILYEDSADIRQESDLVFEDWIPLENNSFVGRSFQFKAVLTSERNDQTPIVDELGVTFQLERRAENSEFMQSGVGTKAVSFDNAFYVDGDTSVSVGITALDMEPEDYFVMSEPTATGFNITFKGTFDGDEVIDRRFSYTAVGYGKREAP
nr:phage-related protein tail component-like protein [uncultured Mediterranean phage uvMED]